MSPLRSLWTSARAAIRRSEVTADSRRRTEDMKQINCRETRAVMSLCLSLEMIESMLLPGQRPIRTIKQNNGESSRPQSHTYKTAVIWPVMQPSCVDRDKMTANSSDTSSVLFHFPLTFFSQPKECIHIKQGRNFISVSAPDPHFCPPK